MKLIRILPAVALVSLMFYVLLGHADTSIPTRLSYQGALKNYTSASSPRQVTFKLYSTSGGSTSFWSETQNLNVTSGRFSTVLGARTSLDISKFGGNTWLGIAVGSDPELAPRQQLTSVPYAFNGVPGGGIIMWNGPANAVPAGWALCDGKNGTPDLTGRFIVGAGTPDSASTTKTTTNYDYGNNGGNLSPTIDLSHGHDISHSHTLAPHNHKGYVDETAGNTAASGNAGDLRAAIGAASGQAQTIAHVAISAINPNNNATTNSTYVAVSGTFTGPQAFSHYTPVLGKTSTITDSIIGQSTTTSGSALTSTDIRPPYYALAYIMKL